MVYTRRQKELLINKYKELTDQKLKLLIEESKAVSESCNHKINRKVNSVNATLWNIKIKHILQLERRKRLNLKTLVKDVEEIKDKE